MTKLQLMEPHTIMQGNRPLPLERELHFEKSDIIVSKTDTKGRITYGNEIFIRLSGYSEEELLGKPHNIVRHPDMPRTIFKILWDSLKEKREIFAYVKNLNKEGSYYWVLANITPSFNGKREIVGYHSMRRFPSPQALEPIKALYAELLEREKQGGIESGMNRLQEILQSKGMSYEQYVLSL